MKKIILTLILLLTCIFMLSGCEQTNTQPNDKDPSLEGIDLDKYEMPQTGFLNDGHELSNFEQMAKYIIENGKFVFDQKLDGIGYKIELDKTTEDGIDCTYLAFYCVDSIKIAKEFTQVVERRSGSGQIRKYNYSAISYVKLTNYDDISELQTCHKLANTMETVLYGIYDLKRSEFDGSENGSYSLWRCIISGLTEENVTSLMLSNVDKALKLFDEKIGQPSGYRLNTIGFDKYN